MNDLASALFSLRRQSIERGFAGRLGDFDVHLSEDCRTVSIWSHYAADVPLMASFELAAPIDPVEFDPQPIYMEAESFAEARATLH